MYNPPPPIRTDRGNEFAFRTMSQRVPENFEAVIERNPDYSTGIKTAIRELSASIRGNAPIALFAPPAPDYETWLESCEKELPATWLQAPWLFAETLAYRKLIDAVRYWESGRDPFLPVKEEELAGPGLRNVFEASLHVTGSPEERIAQAIRLSLWANRIDLSYRESRALGSDPGAQETLVTDDTIHCVPLLAEPGGTVHVVVDNTGSELAADLALTDHLLRIRNRVIILHVKNHPTYVSDATVADVRTLIRRMADSADRGSAARSTQSCANRLLAAFHEGRLRILPHPYWNSDRFLSDMPRGLQSSFAQARMIILKGDMNYRRLAADAIWPVGASFADAVCFMPCPVLAIRTLKGDTLAGGPPDRIAELDSRKPAWKSSGKYAVVQFWPGPSADTTISRTP
ncbi:MAG TPA: ARMT1-like domain-containing protein [Spirochaetia bacterium]|nr:ARMT1-like domain-containing protein [Spirochaetia bacterium]